MPNVHVHWIEYYPKRQIHRVNLIRGYILLNDGHLGNFRKDIHSILNWGIDYKRREAFNERSEYIAEHESGDHQWANGFFKDPDRSLDQDMIWVGESEEGAMSEETSTGAWSPKSFGYVGQGRDEHA